MKNTDPLHDEILTVEQVSEMLHLTPDTIYEKVDRNELPGAFRLGEGKQPPIRFSKRLILEWIHKTATQRLVGDAPPKTD